MLLPAFLILIHFFSFYQTYSQSSHYLDSAIHHRPTAPDKALTWARLAYASAPDTLIKGKSLLLTGTLLSDLSHYDSSLILLHKSLSIFRQMKDSILMSEAYENIGVALEYKSDYQNAQVNYSKAYTIRKKLKLLKEQAYSLNSIGNIDVFLNNYAKALEAFLEALRLGQQIRDDQLITNTYNNIGMVYDYTNDLDKALEYYQKARTGFEKLNNESGLSGALNNIGLIYKNKGEPEKAIPLYLQSLAIYTKLRNGFGMGALQNNLGVAYELLNEFDKALVYHQKALAINTTINNQDGISNSNNSIGNCYVKLKDFEKADKYFFTALTIAKKIKSKDRVAEAFEGLSTSAEASGSYKKSLEYFRQAKIVRDSILTADKFQSLYDMEQKYESAIKQRQIALLNAESEKQKLAIVRQHDLISKKNTQLAFVLSSIVLLAVIVYLFYSRLTLVQNARVNMLRIEKEQAVLKSVYEQRISISKDMHDEIGSGLTHISMLSELINIKKESTVEIRKEIETISDIARKLTESMGEIIWAINPQNETLENLVAYLREQTYKYFEPFVIDYSMNVPDGLPDLKLTNIQRRNLFLVTKETLNNALKHSHASRINFSILIINASLTFTVNDNGTGFSSDEIRRSANGIRNMKSRMEEILGVFDIKSSSQGTTVTYAMPLKQK
jgi:signal transduction histidine kinase